MIYYNGITYRDVRLADFSRLLTYFKEFLKENNSKLANYVPLVTCNRIELYTGMPIKIDRFNQKEGRAALAHLFKVAAGIDSMIVGENEIAVQVRQAYEAAKKEGHCSGYLDIAFMKALKTARRVRVETRINYGRTSLASIAVEHAVKNYRPKKALVIGSGMLAAKIAHALSRKKIEEIILSNRHFKRAEDLAGRVGGKADKLDNLKMLLKTINVVFSATSCPVPVIYKKDVPAAKKIVFIDLAVPNDVDSGVDKMKNVKIVRLPYFKKIIGRNKKEKAEDIKKAEKIVNEEADKIGFI